MRPISAEAREARTWTSVDQLSVRHAAQVWGLMVPRGLEPRTLRLLAVRSNQLSYETIGKHGLHRVAKKNEITASKKMGQAEVLC